MLALALPSLAHLDLSSCRRLRALELRCPRLLALHAQACVSLPRPCLQAAMAQVHAAAGASSRECAMPSAPGSSAAAAIVSAAAAKGKGKGCEGGAEVVVLQQVDVQLAPQLEGLSRGVVMRQAPRF